MRFSWGKENSSIVKLGIVKLGNFSKVEIADKIGAFSFLGYKLMSISKFQKSGRKTIADRLGFSKFGFSNFPISQFQNSLGGVLVLTA